MTISGKPVCYRAILTGAERPVAGGAPPDSILSMTSPRSAGSPLRWHGAPPGTGSVGSGLGRAGFPTEHRAFGPKHGR
jgi:hypothetical protein